MDRSRGALRKHIKSKSQIQIISQVHIQHALAYGLIVKQRIEEAMRRAGYGSVADLAAALAVSPQSIFQVLSGARPGHDLLARIAEKIGVSAIWLRSGDPAEAPDWADRAQVAAQAVRALSARDRRDLFRMLEASSAADDVAQSPAVAASELATLRAEREATRRVLVATRRCARALLDAIDRLEQETGEALVADDAGATLTGIINDIEREIPRAAARETPYDQHRAPRARRGARVAP